MKPFDFRHRPDLPRNEAWQALDCALQRWVLAQGGSRRLAELAAWCSYAEAQGDSAIRVDATGPLVLRADEREAILAESLCSDGGHMAPFVLDDDYFYFWRNYRAETLIASALAERCRCSSGESDVPEDWLDALFRGSDAVASSGQRAAVCAAAMSRLLVLGGGPGTGKTSTVLRILLLLQRLSDQPLTVRVAAPTGKAAQRLLQSLREGRKALSESLGDEWKEALSRIPDQDALTLHRLLEFDPRRNRFRRDADNRIAADVVVIDEASMMDLSSLQVLLSALPTHARLLLVGDPDQLHSVAAGAVLSDIANALQRYSMPQWCLLRHVFRAQAPLLPLLNAVQSGDESGMRASIENAADAITLHAVESRGMLMAALRRWSDHLIRWQANLPGCIERPEQVVAAFRGLAQQQLLCGLREGEFGALACHEVIEQHLRQVLGVDPGEHWYHGRAVMITRNDYGHGLYNGDIGIALKDADGTMKVWFDGEGVRMFTPNALPVHEGAFALTIHKSQGSEYNDVAVLLPPGADQRVLSRQLLYTGLSRARRRVEIWSDDAALRSALMRGAERISGLGERLAKSLALAEISF